MTDWYDLSERYCKAFPTKENSIFPWQVVIGNESSLLHCGVPQGSVLASILFLVYIHSLALLLASHGVDGHFYVDDCQIYLPIANIDETKTKILALLSDINTWIREWKWKLTESKTEIMLIKGNLRTNVTHDFGTWMLKPLHLPHVNTVRNFGILSIFDSENNFQKANWHGC